MKINKQESDSIEKFLDAERIHVADIPDREKVKYDFLQDSEEEEVVADIDFDALVNVSDQNLGTINAEKFVEELDTILFYCKQCKEEVEVERVLDHGKSPVQFKCQECHSSDVIYGTARGVREYYERRL